MSSSRLTGFVAALPVLALGMTVPPASGGAADWAAADDTVGEQVSASTLQVGARTPAQITRGMAGPVLYDNTEICTPNVLGLAVGGSVAFNRPLSVLDWFETGGGQVRGFDLYVLNGGSGAVPNHFQMTFYEGTDADSLGTAIVEAFRTTGAPGLSPIPVYRDAVTGVARMIRATVNYEESTWTVVDAETGAPLISPPVQDLGFRRELRIPSGKVGVDVRFLNEPSICAGGNPVCGVVLARGGQGNQNGVHFPGATVCPADMRPHLCDNADWEPVTRAGDRVPCVGGEICSLNDPHLGIALRLYVSPGEDIPPTVSPQLPDPPDRCSGALTTVAGFLGDNAPLVTGDEEVDYFDCNADGALNIVDYACFQRCFDLPALGGCRLMDRGGSGFVDIDDYFVFAMCSSLRPGSCQGFAPGPAQPSADIDLYNVHTPIAGQVLSVLVEGAAGTGGRPVSNPALRVFTRGGRQFEEVAVSDDFDRFSRDAFTTVVVPGGVSQLWVGVSGSSNVEYDPGDSNTVTPMAEDDTGWYSLTVGLTDPNCVQDDLSGEPTDCYFSQHEPDDTLADADARGALCHPQTAGCFMPYGMIGDGAFAGLGQDIDLYKLQFDDGPRDGVRMVMAQVTRPPGSGFGEAPDIDSALALYDSAGELVATADQGWVGPNSDYSIPILWAPVRGTNAGGDGIYYLGIFGTDRGLRNADCNSVWPPIPPTILNLPHGDGSAGTRLSDLRPVVGGRVNIPGAPLEGCSTDPENDPPAREQCYQILIWTFTSDPQPESDICQTVTDDSILDACPLAAGDRLSAMVAATRTIGDGIYPQGDVDFYEIEATSGDVVAGSVADGAQRPDPQISERSYLALYEEGGTLFADHDYSLEHSLAPGSQYLLDRFAATIAGAVPDMSADVAYLMVGVDAGNLSPVENLPFDAFTPGTTFMGRLSGSLEGAPYLVGAAVMPPVTAVPGSPRMFVVPRGGSDNRHVSCQTGSDLDGSPACFPPILELDPVSGWAIGVIDGRPYFDTSFPADDAGPGGRVSNNPLVAFDGEALWVTVERCIDSGRCRQRGRWLYKVDPDLRPTDPGFVSSPGQIFGDPLIHRLSGLTEAGGYLYMLNDTQNTIRYWDKTSTPASSNGGIMVPEPSAETDNPRWNDLYGDIDLAGSKLYVGCQWYDADTHENGEPGVCVFNTDRVAGTITFDGKLNDPVTNLGFEPGPRLGGLDVVDGDWIIASDRNGSIIEHWDTTTDTVYAVELRREFTVVQLTAR